jgi:hypothetical protein
MGPTYVVVYCIVQLLHRYRDQSRCTVVLLCSNWSLKKLFSPVGQRKKSRVAEPRVIFGVPTSENNF